VAVGDFNADGIPDLAVTNTKDTTVSVLLGDGTGKFHVAESPAVGNGPRFVVVGDFNGDGKLDLANVNTNDNTVSVLLNDVPLAIVSPANLAFGTQIIGTSSTPQPVTLTNTGARTLRVFKIAVASTNFSQTNNCPSSIPTGGQCTINVALNPSKINKVYGNLVITDNAPTNPQRVPLAGIGTAVGLSPSSLNFGDQPVGTTSPPQPVTLTNYGTAAVSIGGIHVIGKNHVAFDQTNNCGTSVPGGGSCTINVTFTPQAKGAKSATLEVVDNGGASPQTVALSGTGTE